VQNPHGSPLPGDAASVAPSNGYSCDFALSSGYAGNLCQVTATGGGTAVISQTNGRANMAAVAKLCANTSCGISIAYDQFGSANAVQATFANMPPVTVDPDGSVHISTPNIVTDTSSAVRLVASGVSLTKNSLSVAFLGRTRGAVAFGDTGTSPVAGPANLALIGNNSANFDLIQWFQNGVTIYGDGSYSGWLSNRDSVVIATSGASAHGVSTDAQTPYSLSALSATALSGLTIGNMTSSVGPVNGAQQVDVRAILLWASALSNADQAAVRQAMYVAGNTVPQARCSIVGMGESVLWGNYQDPGQGIVDALRSLLPTSTVVFNRAVPAQQIGPVGTSGTMLNWYVNSPAYYTALYNAANACNILLINPGLNDINAGRTTAQVEADLTSVIQDAEAIGFKVAVLGWIDRLDSAGNETAHDTLNTWFRGGAIAALGATPIDWAADPLLGADGAANNTACFYTDKVHLIDACANGNAAPQIANGLISSGLLSY
jgi:hypothetical protein